ncbi:MAG TPA: DUF6152 family protein [Caulobacteraceae bacterium]|jgi:hypothetical protein|nr:DUF6152 family protein [Caulobacteraceae bacterium]
MSRLIMKAVLAAGVSAVVLGAGPEAGAHHSFAMFDQTKEVVLDGVVKEFQWTNPHSWIELVVDEGGRQVDYAIESGSMNTLTRNGWTRKSLKEGDRIKLKIHPLKDGMPGGSFLSATFEDGRVLVNQGN